ncbi:MAG: ABC transporter ATP-binding protein [Clostridiales bacterium]|nr:ABC transporter ATP-binding protein [Clostridiales bacterium]
MNNIRKTNASAPADIGKNTIIPGTSGPHIQGSVTAIQLKGASAKDFKRTAKRFLSLLKPYRRMLGIAALVSVLSTAFTIVSPKLLGTITSSLQISITMNTAFDLNAALKTITALVALYLLTWVLGYIKQHILVGLTQSFIRDLRQRVDRKLGKLPLRFFDTSQIGDIMSRATNDIDNISTALQTSFSELIVSAVTIIGVIPAMLLIDPLIALICIITIPLGTIITAVIVRKSQKYFKRQASLLGSINTSVEECFTGHKIIKAFSREKHATDKFAKISDAYCDAASRAQYASSFTYPLTSLVNELAFIAICVVGGLKVVSGSILLGDIQALFAYAQLISSPVTQITNMMSILQTTAASAERIFDLLDQEERTPDGQRNLPETIKGAVSFENVFFSYDSERTLIENFNLDVEPGRTVAIVGHTGAGKTTLVNLLMRFYDLDGGSIKIDGIDIRELSGQSLRKHIGMVLQDTWLIEGTIAENIAYGSANPELITRGQIVSAAKVAMADGFIRVLPEGYDTVLNEETDNLSQGQKQLLTIARAVLLSPDILILDEATSNVDTRTEKLIQAAMKKLMHGRTCFIIAHRLSTIRDAEQIIVMKNGSVTETGTHESLMKKKGEYFELYNSQFSGKII